MPHRYTKNLSRVEKFTNHVMSQGKKSVARRMLDEAFEKIKAKTGQPAEIVFEKALQNVSPVLEVKARRIGGSNYQIPTEVTPNRRQTLAFRWLIGAARSKKGANMASKLADELLAASQNAGDAIKKKDETHRMAEANKAFAHLARYR